MIFTILRKTSTPFPNVLYLDGIDHKYPPQQQNLCRTLDCIISNTTPLDHTEGKQICKPHRVRVCIVLPYVYLMEILTVDQSINSSL